MSCPFPVGGIFITVSDQHPSTTRPGTFREPFGTGRAIVCCSTNPESSFYPPEYEFGSASQQFTVAGSSIKTGDGNAISVVNDVVPNDGGVITVSHYQPSITAYVRKRVQTTNDFNPFNIADAFTPTGDVFPKNVIIDKQTLSPQYPNPYEPS